MRETHWHYRETNRLTREKKSCANGKERKREEGAWETGGKREG